MMSEDAKDKYIGVHCTHGINRTGYMICLYMIRKLGIAPKDAISTFQKARGHHIVRSYLLQPLLGNNSATTQEHSNVNHPQPNKKFKKNSRHTPGTNSRNHQGSYGPKHMPSNRNTHNIPRFQEPPDMNWESSDTYQDPPDMNWESPDTYQDPPDMNWGSSDTYQGPSNMKRDSLDMHQDLPDMNRVSPDTYRKPPTMIRDTLEMFQNPPVNRVSQEVLPNSPLNTPNMPTGKRWLNVDGFKKKIRDKYSSYNQDNRSERNDFLRSMWANKRDRILPERNDQQ